MAKTTMHIMITDKFEAIHSSILLFLLLYQTTTTFLFLESGAGLNSMKHMNAKTRIAKISPAILMFPVNIQPNWYIIRAIA